MGAVQTAPPCTSRARQPPMAVSEPTLGTRRGAQLASPGQRALPAPCDFGLWARSLLFGHGESGAPAGWAAPPFPARAEHPRGPCSVPAAAPGSRRGRAAACGTAGQGRTGLGGPGGGGAPGDPERPPAPGRRRRSLLCVEGLGLRWDPCGPPDSVTLFGPGEPGKPPREGVVFFFFLRRDLCTVYLY